MEDEVRRILGEATDAPEPRESLADIALSLVGPEHALTSICRAVTRPAGQRCLTPLPSRSLAGGSPAARLTPRVDASETPRVERLIRGHGDV